MSSLAWSSRTRTSLATCQTLLIWPPFSSLFQTRTSSTHACITCYVTIVLILCLAVSVNTFSLLTSISWEVYSNVTHSSYWIRNKTSVHNINRKYICIISNCVIKKRVICNFWPLLKLSNYSAKMAKFWIIQILNWPPNGVISILTTLFCSGRSSGKFERNPLASSSIKLATSSMLIKQMFYFSQLTSV